MKKTPISVTEAARNFADCVNRVRYQNMTFVLLKNGYPSPDLSPIVRRPALAASWRKPGRFDLSPENARAWQRISASPQNVRPPVDRWR